MNATSAEAKESERKLETIIKNRSTNISKMLNFKKWWWRRRIRWQKWCRASSTTYVSSAEVLNARSVLSSEYRKRLLDVVTTECSTAVLEAAEIKRQQRGLKTVGRSPTAADRSEKEDSTLALDRERAASAVQFVAENADNLSLMSDIEMAQDEYRVNTRDTHRADKSRKAQLSNKGSQARNVSVSKNNLSFFKKYIEDVSMDVNECRSSMTNFQFKLLDTMGYVQDMTLSKDYVTCSSHSCQPLCHHIVWILHVFKIQKNQPILYKKRFSSSEWETILQSFPVNVQLARLPAAKLQYSLNIRDSKKDASCANCKTLIRRGNVQVTADGPYRTIMRQWITRKFFFCPKLSCISKMPRNSYIRPYCPSTMTLDFDSRLTTGQKRLLDVTRNT